MAKMFCTLEEAAVRLGKTPDEVRAMGQSGTLQEFRDRDRLMFKKEQVETLAPPMSDPDFSTESSVGSSEETPTEKGWKLHGLDEDTLGDLIRDLLRAPAMLGICSTRRGEILLDLILERELSEDDKKDPHWIKVAQTLVDQLPRRFTKMFVGALEEGGHEATFKEHAEDTESAVQLLISAWREKKNLNRSEVEVVMKAILWLSLFMQFDFFVRVAGEGWIKSAADPDRRTDFLSQLVAAVGDPVAAEQVLEGIRIDERVNELNKTLQTLIAHMPES